MTSAALCSSPVFLESSSAAQPIVARHNTTTAIDSNFIALHPPVCYLFYLCRPSLSFQSFFRFPQHRSGYPSQQLSSNADQSRRELNTHRMIGSMGLRHEFPQDGIHRCRKECAATRLKVGGFCFRATYKKATRQQGDLFFKGE